MVRGFFYVWAIPIDAPKTPAPAFRSKSSQQKRRTHSSAWAPAVATACWLPQAFVAPGFPLQSGAIKTILQPVKGTPLL